MAPLPPSLKKPSARTLRHQRLTGQIHPLLPSKIFRSDAAVTDSFLSTKRDKRLMKSSSFVSRISAAPSRVSKRRRPSKKLVTNLDSLADALPELAEGEGQAEVLDGKIKHKSLKSKKGALRRKEGVVRGEMQRFGVSMARLADSGHGKTMAGAAAPGAATAAAMNTTQETAAPAQTSNRWAALRGYISSTMEQNPAFVNKD